MTSRTARLAKISLSMAGAEGLQRSSSPRVAAALQLLDPERVSSVPSILAAYQQRVAAIHGDKDLSPSGKRGRVAAQADSALGNVATVAKRIAALEAEHRNATENAVQIPKADAAEALVDLALAQHLRESKPIQSALLRASERVRLAAARMPVELTGLAASVQAAVRGSLVDPKVAVEMGEESRALDAARHVVQSAINELAPDAAWTPREWAESFGEGWRLPGVAASLAERMSTEGSASAEAAS